MNAHYDIAFFSIAFRIAFGATLGWSIAKFLISTGLELFTWLAT